MILLFNILSYKRFESCVLLKCIMITWVDQICQDIVVYQIPMKKISLPYICLLVAISLSGCGLMEDAFKTGFIIALVLAAIIGLLIWILHILTKVLCRYFPVFRSLEDFWDE